MRILLTCFFVLLVASFASAHPMPQSEVRLTLRGTDVLAEVRLPVCELKLGWQKPFPLNDADAVIRDYGSELPRYVMDHFHVTSPTGKAWQVALEKEPTPMREAMQEVLLTLRLTPPAGQPVDKFQLHYDVITHQLVTHSALVTVQRDWRNGVIEESSELIGTLDDQHRDLNVDRSKGSLAAGFSALVRLGVDHIREGTDHLLFLLALLLPAPLRAKGRQWAEAMSVREGLLRIAKVVSGFTVGHSVTLLLGALGVVNVNTRLVECLIALSVLVSAIHALVPILKGKEVLVAAGFGLIHGLAFATTIEAMGFDLQTLLLSILGFNLGIEGFQLLVVALTMPSLMVLARTRIYPGIRWLGGMTAVFASLAWLADRAFGWTSPAVGWTDRLTQYGGGIVIGLLLIAIVFRPRRARVATT